MKPITRENIANHLLEIQLEMAGKQMIELLDDDRWRFNWTLTSQEHILFKEYSIPLLKKTFRCNKAKADGIFEWFCGKFGLRVKN